MMLTEGPRFLLGWVRQREGVRIRHERECKLPTHALLYHENIFTIQDSVGKQPTGPLCASGDFPERGAGT